MDHRFLVIGFLVLTLVQFAQVFWLAHVVPRFVASFFVDREVSPELTYKVVYTALIYLVIDLVGNACSWVVIAGFSNGS